MKLIPFDNVPAQADSQSGHRPFEIAGAVLDKLETARGVTVAVNTKQTPKPGDTVIAIVGGKQRMVPFDNQGKIIGVVLGKLQHPDEL